MKSLKIYQNQTLIGEYLENSPTYNKLWEVLCMKDYISAIQEEQVSSVQMSSWYDDTLKQYKINSPKSWSSSVDGIQFPGHDWIQVDFDALRTVVGIQLQGRKDMDHWLTKFKLESSENGKDFLCVCNGIEFIGCSDRSTIKYTSMPKFTAKSMRLIPMAHSAWRSCRFDVKIERQDLNKQVADIKVTNVEQKEQQKPYVQQLADNSIVQNVTFSSVQQHLKLYELNSAECWAAHPSTAKIPERDYIQFQFKNIVTVTAIDIQGRRRARGWAGDQWVTKFKLMYSFNGYDFNYVSDGKQFDGNWDRQTIRTIPIPKFDAKYIRMVPTGYYNNKACRIGVRILK